MAADGDGDAVKAFAHIVDNVPLWHKKLQDLSAKCDRSSVQNQEIIRKRKSVSVESLRPEMKEDIEPLVVQARDEMKSSETQVSPGAQPLPTKDTDVSPLNGLEGQRKRPANSELSGSPSTHYRPRHKRLLVVWYDSEIQNDFEGLVKLMSTSRNHLRKGKNAATFSSRLASMTMGGDHEIGSTGFDSKLMRASFTRARLSRGSTSGELKCYEDADRHIEEAQSFCEKGAHQILREGKCPSEIEGVRRHMLRCEQVAKVELERLKQQSKQSEQQESPEQTLVGTPPDKEEPILEMVDDIKQPNPPALKVLNTGPIEIDDNASSNSDSVQLDLSHIRRTVIRSGRI